MVICLHWQALRLASSKNLTSPGSIYAPHKVRSQLRTIDTSYLPMAREAAYMKTTITLSSMTTPGSTWIAEVQVAQFFNPTISNTKEVWYIELTIYIVDFHVQVWHLWHLTWWWNSVTSTRSIWSWHFYHAREIAFWKLVHFFRNPVKNV